MNKKRIICCVITARPSYARIKTVLTAIKKHPNLKLIILVSGSANLERYGNVSKVIEEDGFVVNEKIFISLEGGSPYLMAKATGLATSEISVCIANFKPDVVITIADRFETLGTSIAAAYQNIPLAHIQGGEVTGSIDEKVRHCNTKLADIHFVASQDAYERVVKMGENKKTVFNTGCPANDLALDAIKYKELSFNPIEHGVGEIKNWKNGYIISMQHPVTTEYKDAGRQVLETLSAVQELDIPTFWFWPNIDAGTDKISHVIRQFRELNNPKNILFIKNMKPENFLNLLNNSLCLVGNSSVGIRESSLIGVPVVNLGTRQYHRLRSNNVIDCKHDKESIIKSVTSQMNHGFYASSAIYGDGHSGERIAEILATCELNSNKTIAY